MSAVHADLELMVERQRERPAPHSWPEGAAAGVGPIPAQLRPALLEELIVERMLLERQLVELIDFELQLDDSIARLLSQLGSDPRVGELIRTCFERARCRVRDQPAPPGA